MIVKEHKTNVYIFILAIVIALLILINGNFALWQMEKIKGEFYGVANRDIPLVSKLFPLIDRQFEQTLLIEKISQTDVNHKILLVATLEESFLKTGDAFDTTLLHLNTFITPLLKNKNPDTHNEMVQVLDLLKRIGKEHREYQVNVVLLVETMKKHETDTIHTLFSKISAEEKDLRHELLSLRNQTQLFTEQSAKDVEEHEEHMIKGMALFSIGVFSVGILMLFLIYQVMKARSKAITKITHMAMYDPLTDLLNRRTFFEQLNAAIQLSKRHSIPLSLCICDLDKFKEVNDTLGHQVGDEVLSYFSTLLKESIRTEDIAGRFGGDEFVLFFPNTKATDAVNLIERIRKQLEEKIFSHPSNDSFSITATFGMAELSNQSLDNDHFLEQADIALYRAKEHGRNQIAVYDVP